MKAKRLISLLAGLMPLAAQGQDLPTATQIIDVMSAANQGMPALIQGFGTLGFDVKVIDQTWPSGQPGPGDYFALLDLWADQQPYANALCISAGPTTADALAAMLAAEQSPLTDAAGRPFVSAFSRRILCSYVQWRTQAELSVFNDAASAWAEAEIGPITLVPLDYDVVMKTVVMPELIGTDRPWAMQLLLVNGGDESTMALSILTDFSAPGS